MIDAATQDGIRASFEAFFAGDLDQTMAMTTPDVISYDVEEMPDSSVLHGREELRQRLLGFLEIFEDLSLERLDIHEVGERLLVVVQIHAHARATRIPLDQELAYLCRVQDGLVTEIRVFFSEADARAFAASCE